MGRPRIHFHSYKSDRRTAKKWTDEQNAWLVLKCKTADSFNELATEFNAKFPGERKSRNAILGRAHRLKLTADKPCRQQRGRPRPRKKIKSNPMSKRVKIAKVEAPVVFKQTAGSAMLRHEGDRAITPKGGARKMSYADPVVIERRKGNLPAIIEERPLTSVAVALCEKGSCMWPTSEDVTCMEVCGAPVEVGAYCARHAEVAYRVMPTGRRNSVHSKHNVEHTRRIDASQHRDTLDPDGEWLGRMILDEVVTAPADEPPLLLPRFIGVKS
jgi:hypothetical protein